MAKLGLSRKYDCFYQQTTSNIGHGLFILAAIIFLLFIAIVWC